MVGRKKTLVALGAAATALALLLVAAGVAGSQPQQLLAGVAGPGSHVGEGRPYLCCTARFACPVEGGFSAATYCCWCRCYRPPPMALAGTQAVPCVLAGGHCCPPPPCSGLCRLEWRGPDRIVSKGFEDQASLEA